MGMTMSLIKDLDKKPYQEFLVEMGIDRVSILIPIKKSNDFILEANEKLVKDFGAMPFSSLKDIPDFYTFTKGLIYSHRDFDKFYKALKKGEKCAIVSGVNASGTFHIGHKVVFDTNLYFQKKFDTQHHAV